MGQPHKHAELIKAWADGAIIEYKDVFGNWELPVRQPVWDTKLEYRIKPKTTKKMKYRLYLTCWDTIGICNKSSPIESPPLHSFVRWLTEEQEVEVEV